MKFKSHALSALTAVSLLAASISPASAYGYYHHHHGFPLFGAVLGAGVAVGVAAVTIATAPVRIVANAVSPYPCRIRYAAPAPVYYAPSPPYAYAPAPVVYAQPVYPY